MRTVGGHREVVGALSPEDIGDEPVDEAVSGSDGARLRRFIDRGYGDGFNRLDTHVRSGRDGHETITIEGALGIERYEAWLGTEGVEELHTLVGNAQIGAVAAAFRPVHSTFLCSVAVVQ